MQKHAAACVCVKILRAVPFPHTVIRTGEMEKYDEIDGQAFGVGSFFRAFVFRALRFWCTRTHFRPRAPSTVAVPEGGTSLMYLLLAGLSCVGAMVLRYRRQAGVRETN